MYVYPANPPFISKQNLEDIALFDMELDVPYAPWYDEYATVHELAPGEMLTWPTNAPHRVQNLDCLNVSLTVSYYTEEIARAQTVLLANGILRHKFGFKNLSNRITGPSFWAKKIAQRLLRDSSWIKTARSERRTVQFTLDKRNLGQVLDIPVVEAAE